MDGYQVGKDMQEVIQRLERIENIVDPNSDKVVFAGTPRRAEEIEINNQRWFSWTCAPNRFEFIGKFSGDYLVTADNVDWTYDNMNRITSPKGSGVFAPDDYYAPSKYQFGIVVGVATFGGISGKWGGWLHNEVFQVYSEPSMVTFSGHNLAVVVNDKVGTLGDNSGAFRFSLRPAG
jgi:hypothetical protein